MDGQDLGDLNHSWGPTHGAWDGGRYNARVANKSEMTMGPATSNPPDYNPPDVSATVAGDSTWLRRFAGHVENGVPSITG